MGIRGIGNIDVQKPAKDDLVKNGHIQAPYALRDVPEASGEVRRVPRCKDPRTPAPFQGEADGDPPLSLPGDGLEEWATRGIIMAPPQEELPKEEVLLKALQEMCRLDPVDSLNQFMGRVDDEPVSLHGREVHERPLGWILRVPAPCLGLLLLPELKAGLVTVVAIRDEHGLGAHGLDQPLDPLRFLEDP